jgi:Family of unknown function (DUF5670)
MDAGETEASEIGDAGQRTSNNRQRIGVEAPQIEGKPKAKTDRATYLNQSKELKTMLWTIAIILIVLWAFGLLTHVAGGLIHVLLVIAIIVIVLNLVRGRRIL